MKERINKMMGVWRRKLPLPALGVLAVGCLLLLMPVEGENRERASPEREMAAEFELEAFEGQLESVLSEIRGAGKTRVLLTVDEGSRTLLAQDREQTDDRASVQTVTLGSSGQQVVVPVQTVAPRFRGALVVSPGAETPSVRLALTEAVGVLTGLGSDCICVTAGSL